MMCDSYSTDKFVVALSLLALTRHCSPKPERGFELGLEGVVMNRERFVDPERQGE